MPWVSNSQRKWGHSPAGVQALGGEDAVKEWDDATGDTKLPDKKDGTDSHWPGAIVSAARKKSGNRYRSFESGY